MFVNYSFFTLCLLHMAKCLWWLPFCQNLRNMFGVETHECALAEKTGTKGCDFDKNRYKFYMKFILIIDTWHIIIGLIVLNHSKCSVFSLKHSRFTINKEGPNNGSTWPLRTEWWGTDTIFIVWERKRLLLWKKSSCRMHI